MNVRTSHPKPACRCVTKIVEPEVNDTGVRTRLAEGLGGVVRIKVKDQGVRRAAVRL